MMRIYGTKVDLMLPLIFTQFQIRII